MGSGSPPGRRSTPTSVHDRVQQPLPPRQRHPRSRSTRASRSHLRQDRLSRRGRVLQRLSPNATVSGGPLIDLASIYVGPVAVLFRQPATGKRHWPGVLRVQRLTCEYRADVDVGSKPVLIKLDNVTVVLDVRGSPHRTESKPPFTRNSSGTQAVPDREGSE